MYLAQDFEDTIEEQEFARPDDHSPVKLLNECLGNLSDAIRKPRNEPIRTQVPCLKECPTDEKSNVIQKTEEACLLVCEVIAPNDPDQLFQEVLKKYQAKNSTLDTGIQALLAAYQSAPSNCLKTQILSIYAKNYTFKELKAMHLPFEELSDRKIKKARALATEEFPGAFIEKKTQHRVRMDKAKLDHFLEFTWRPYYYQDVAFGSRTIKLESGEEIVMPNVVRTVARCTIIKQYLEYCDETSFQPISRSSMWRVLEVQEASQRKSLRGLDNTAAEGADAFDTLHRTVNELESAGADKNWCTTAHENLSQGKLYLKTTYRDHCQGESNTCPDHCKPFALSDPHDSDYQKKCNHKHDTLCANCENLKDTLRNIAAEILAHTIKLGKDRAEDLQYDVKIAVSHIFQWKAHVLRAQNQDQAKQKILTTLKVEETLIIIDWAMKFTTMKYREKQTEWFGKRGINWHVSCVATRSPSNDLEVISYVHLLNSCRQDWYSVLSIIEHLFSLIKQRNSSVTKAYIRSDEAGCYHNSMLISSLHDLGKRHEIEVARYDHSEPQSGKDVCDRILCPLKASIKRYCNEGHDIITAEDMHTALKERPVGGTTASVCTIEEQNKTLEMNKIDDYSKLHNFKFTKTGLRVWKAFDIGPGKLLLLNDLIKCAQGATNPKEEIEAFPTNARKFASKKVSDQVSQEKKYECPDPACTEEFGKHSELELHLNIYGHRTVSHNVKETLYDQIRRDWVHRFETLSLNDETSSTASKATSKEKLHHPPLSMGWALHQKGSSKRFPTKVRQYLITKFKMGQETGRKEDPAQVAKDMRTALTGDGERFFNRTDWLTKSQIQGFFSRLSKKVKEGQVVTAEDNESEFSNEDDIEQYACEEDDELLSEIRQSVLDKVGVTHPITFDVYNLCTMTHEHRISAFKVKMLKEICNYFELPFKSRDNKANLVAKIEEMIYGCSCNGAHTK